jgi:predicted exporter/SAM-dependent methyltransferase
MNRIVVAIYEFLKNRKGLFYSILISLVVVLGFFASRITLEKDITKMIPDDKETIGYKETIQNVRILDKIIVSFQADSNGMEDTLIASAEKFVAELKSDSSLNGLLSDIRYRVDDERIAGVTDLIYSNLPIYLSDKDYQRMDSLTSEAGIKEGMERSYRKLISPASFVLKQFVLKDPLSLSTPAFKEFSSMQADENYALQNGYIFRKNKNTLVVFLTPTNAANKTDINGKLIDGLDHTIQSTHAQFKNVHIDYFGAAAVAVANARQIEKDIKVISTIAIIIILGFLYFFYRSWSLPLLMITPIAFGGIFSLAIIYFIQGTISAIAIGAGSVIIGIALDYSFHVFAHYQHTRNIKTVVGDIAVPMMIGSVSTVGAFFSLLYVHSDILSDFGLFAGLCLIGASVFALFFLPHLIEQFSNVSQADSAAHKQNKAESFLLKWIDRTSVTSKWFVATIIVLTLVLGYFSNRVTFDSDLSSMNYMPESLKAAEKKLYESDSNSGKAVFFIFKGKDISEALYRNEEALTIIDSLKEKAHIQSYAGISGLLPSDAVQLQRIARWKAYWTPEKIAQVKEYVSKYSMELGFNASAFQPFFESLSKEYIVMNTAHRSFLQEVFLQDYVQIDSNNVSVLASMRIPTNFSTDNYKLFDRIEGLTILDRQLFYNKFLMIVKDDFNQILFSSSLFVFLILLISYGRMELSLISFLPMLISWFWILGFMGLFNIHFNIVNIIISTFVFGLGDDYSIFITDGLQKKYAEGKDNLPSFKISIFLSALTTIIAMGALIFAEHPALKSIALISIIGIACVLFISYTIIPLLFALFITNRTDKGKAPFTLAILFRTVVYALVGCALLVPMFVLRVICKGLYLIGLKSISRDLYKTLFSGGLKILFFLSFYMEIKAESIHPNKKNAVILCNDASPLALLIILSIDSSIVIVKNNTEIHSILSRILLFMQDIVAVDTNDSRKAIANIISDGFTPMVFCTLETEEDQVYVRMDESLLQSEELVEYIPMYITGTENCLQPTDFVLNRGVIWIKQYACVDSSAIDLWHRIAATYNIAYMEALKGMPMSNYFNKILSSYIYKGPVLEWYYRIKVALEKSYQEFDDLLPRNGRIYDLGCGYGFLDYFLYAKSSDRTIIGVDYDGDKITVANQSYLKQEKLTFIESDVMKVDVQEADAVVILDVLHYLSADNQQKIIRSSFEGLKNGGILIIRDGDSSQTEKHKGTKLTEFFSTKVLMFNKKTEAELCFLSSETITSTLKDFNVEVKIVDRTKYTSNIVYYVRK